MKENNGTDLIILIAVILTGVLLLGNYARHTENFKEGLKQHLRHNTFLEHPNKVIK